MHHATIHTAAAADEYVNVVTHKSEAKFPFSVLHSGAMRFGRESAPRKIRFDPLSLFFVSIFLAFDAKYMHALFLELANVIQVQRIFDLMSCKPTKKEKSMNRMYLLFETGGEKNPSTNCISINLNKNKYKFMQLL